MWLVGDVGASGLSVLPGELLLDVGGTGRVSGESRRVVLESLMPESLLSSGSLGGLGNSFLLLAGGLLSLSQLALELGDLLFNLSGRDVDGDGVLSGASRKNLVEVLEFLANPVVLEAVLGDDLGGLLSGSSWGILKEL